MRKTYAICEAFHHDGVCFHAFSFSFACWQGEALDLPVPAAPEAKQPAQPEEDEVEFVPRKLTRSEKMKQKKLQKLKETKEKTAIRSSLLSSLQYAVLCCLILLLLPS